MHNPVSWWFNWLQEGAPAGPVERYPALSEAGESSLPGVYVVGDLTGIPLLKLAAESGHQLVEHLVEQPELASRRGRVQDQDVVDLLIVGAGPAGIAAALNAQKHKLSFRILDSGSPFSTIRGFPRGKPIYVEPHEPPAKARLRIEDGVKESLLEDLEQQLAEADLSVEEGIRVERVERRAELVVATDQAGKEHRGLALALAIGKSGDPRRLGVPGEDLPHVSARLFDPAHHQDEDVVVVGGGDSALEAAIALCNAGNRVTLSYRSEQLTRPKEGNLEQLEQLVSAGRISLRLRSQVEAIEAGTLRLRAEAGSEDVPAQAVYVLIGTELPLAFFRRSGIRIEGERSRTGRLLFLLSILFANIIYFGKSASPSLLLPEAATSWTEILRALLETSTWASFFAKPGQWLGASWGAWTWKGLMLQGVAWLSLLALLPTLLLLAWSARKRLSAGSLNTWQRIKYAYFALAFTGFCTLFFGSRYFGLDLGGRSPGFYYGLLYCVTMTLFGARRIHVRPTPYIRAQTLTLVSIQWVMLWLLPEIFFPWLGAHGYLGGPEGFWMSQVFPNQSYWRAYGFILAWPLFIWNLFTHQPTGFWLLVSFLQTFVLIPWGIRHFGKGFYCGWICSCGGLAETLGDEYRSLAPHGPGAKRWENAGQVVLAVVAAMTALKLLNSFGVVQTSAADYIGQGYHLVVDVIFAGVLGVGVYFFLSGRVWCRFLCPLAALMHIYTKFTRYRIFSRKKRCISCNVCTRACHMGIDVMSYAVRGRPLDDVQCVRCSACVVSCPMDVLAFGKLASDGSMIAPRLHATLFEPVDWQGHDASYDQKLEADARFIFDPVKKRPTEKKRP